MNSINTASSLQILDTPLLSIKGNNQYHRSITDGLLKILGRATLIAEINKQKLIQKGCHITLPIEGKLRGNTGVTFVIYHVPFTKSGDKSIGSFDVPKIDHSKIKHLEIVRWTIKSIQEAVPNAEIVICTDEQFGSQLKDLNPTIIIPDVDPNRPMYYRARTYNTLIQNKCTQGVTVFLDSDAIVLKDPSYLVQQLNFKVGLTARFSPNLMPINEGVIITKPDSKECIDFFAHYMGTYEAIKDDSIIKSVSQNDLMRWRGGQLSLNAVCKGVKLLDPRDSSKDVKILPCRKYNYAVKSKDEVFKLKRNSYVHIAHIKGKAKY